MTNDYDDLILSKSILEEKLQGDILIIVGVISAAHGIKGRVMVKSFTDPKSNITKLPIVNQMGDPIKIKIDQVASNGNLICTIENCSDRTEAMLFARRPLFCLRSKLPKITDEDVFYVESLKGMKVVNSEGHHVANVINVANYGGGDILELQFIESKKVEMFPFEKDLFPEITEGHIVYTPY